MTIKELINELLECPMGAEVKVVVEMHKDFMKERLNQYEGQYDYPVSDDADIMDVREVCHNHIRIFLEDALDWR